MKKLGIIGLLGIFMVFFLQGGINVLGPAITGISRGLNIDPNRAAQVGTLPAIFAVLASFLAGRFAGTKIKYKTIIVGSLFISVIGGCLPVFIPTWPLILFSRACVGFGVGIAFALPPSLIMKFYQGDQQRNSMGIANAFSSAGGLVMTFFVGVLVDIRWNLVFIVNILGAIGLLLILFAMPEPGVSARETAARAKGEKIRITLPAPVIVNCVIVFAAFCLWVTALLAVSTIIIGRGLGTGFHAGTVSIMFNISATALSFVFGPIYRVLKKFMSVVILFLVGAGMCLVYNANSLFMAGAGMFLIGTILLIIPTLLMDNGRYLDPESVTFANSLFMVFLNMGNFLTGPFIRLIAGIAGDIQIPGLFFGFIGMFALAVITLMVRIIQKDPPVMKGLPI